MLWSLTAGDNRCLYATCSSVDFRPPPAYFAEQMTSNPRPVRFLAAGDTALVVEFADNVDRAVSDRVIGLADAVEARAIPGVVELVPTFRSLMVHYDPLRISYGDLEAAIAPLLDGIGAVNHRERLFTLPVSYGGAFGPDLEEVAERTGMSPAEVVRLHTSVTYHVYTIGFLPGYSYMGDGPAELSLPRRETPRLRVPMGSVSIAFRQVGIYSLESPGGWNLLGRTPVRLFDTRRAKPVLLTPGDKVRLEPISADDYHRLADQAAAGRLDIQPIGETA
jgi:KipI family sensor histidine kinase inhibitor